jgi:hypothetical protein
MVERENTHINALLRLEPETVFTATEASALSASIRMGDETIQVWNESWCNDLEANIQANLLDIVRLLNVSQPASSCLYWDLSIENTATLGDFKPDGHGRIDRAVAFQRSLPHLAVLVEVKTSSKIKSEGVGKSSFNFGCQF